MAPPTSTFLHLAPQQVVVRRWSAQQELLLPLDDEDEVGASRLLGCWLAACSAAGWPAGAGWLSWPGPVGAAA